jgi:hypothetical protein
VESFGVQWEAALSGVDSVEGIQSVTGIIEVSH